MNGRWQRTGRVGSGKDCPSWETLIDLTYDELEADFAAEVRSHIAQCEGCSASFKELLSVLKLADELPGGPVSPSPVVERHLKQMVAGRRSLLRRFGDWFWKTAHTPVPAYQVLVLAALLAAVFHLLSVISPAGLEEVAHQIQTLESTRPGAAPGASHAGMMGLNTAPATDWTIRRIEPEAAATPAVYPRQALRFSDSPDTDATIAEVF